MVAQARFRPIGRELNYLTAFAQASDALDVAGRIAQKNEDIEGLSSVAALYIELAVRLMGPVHEMEEEEESDEKQPLGFRPEVTIVPVEEVEFSE